MRKVKIIATLGNSTEKILQQIIEDKVDAILIDNYFWTKEDSKKIIAEIKKIREEKNRNVAIIYDLDHIYSQNKYKLIKIDEDNIDFACEQDIDFVSCPFTNITDIVNVKNKLERLGISLIVKIDCKEAYKNLESILEIADSVMINRDELGMELPYEDLPIIQKEIIIKANRYAKEVILTTQMLHSMIFNPRPTRAEVSDVANAIIDGVDAIMLVEETATGEYPLEALSTMDKIITFIENEKTRNEKEKLYKINKMEIAHAIAISIKHLIEDLDIKNIVTYTKSGKTAKFIAKYRPKVPTLAVVPSKKVARKLSLTRGVIATIEEKTLKMEQMLEHAPIVSEKTNLAMQGDFILITAGEPDLGKGTTPPTDFINVRKVK